MKQLAQRPWVPSHAEDYIQSLAQEYAAYNADRLDEEIVALIDRNRDIHERQCVNLNPAANIMNPRAEAVLSSGLGTRPSLGYPGDKYEMGLEAIEKIEVLTTELVCEIFNARYAEIRVASGSIANLYAFMATCKPGDTIIVPPTEIAGHVTHHESGAAGLYGLNIHTASADSESFSIDPEALRQQARHIRPRLITIGGSLNLFPHPLDEIRQIADEVGAFVLFDAAHLSGMIAGGVWPQPLAEGAHIMTMSTYKSLGGPPSGLIFTNDPEMAKRIDRIAFPGLTANFDVAKSAALAIALLDWKIYGPDYAATMVKTAVALAEKLAEQDVPVFAAGKGYTTSHQFAIEAGAFGGGQQAARLLRRANVLACGIGLPIEPANGDLNGLRLGTPEIVRWGMKPEDMAELADLLGRVLTKCEHPEKVAKEVTAFRNRFRRLHFIR